MTPLQTLLREARSAKGWSLREAAQKLGTSRNHLHDLEAGRSDNPTLRVLSAMAQVYDISIASLLPKQQGTSLKDELAWRASTVDPEARTDFLDALEAAFWSFDARRKGYGNWKNAPQSERDAFKAECAELACAYFDAKSIPLGFKVVPWTLDAARKESTS